MQELKSNIEKHYGIDDIHSNSRKTPYIMARSMFAVMAKFGVRRLSYLKVAKCLCKKQHGTIMNSVKQFYNLYTTDKEYKSKSDLFMSNFYPTFDFDIKIIKEHI